MSGATFSETVIKTKASSPCIGVCSTVFGDDVCRGCKRFSHEVISWNTYSEQQKQAVLARLEKLLSQAVTDHLEVFDEERLRASHAELGTGRPPASSPHRLAYELLRLGVCNHLDELSEFGIGLIGPQLPPGGLEGLLSLVEQKFHELSLHYYERRVQLSLRW